MNSIEVHVGSRIRMYRKNRHMTIDELASRINKSRATVSKYESGNISIDVSTLLDIAKALDLDLAQLVDYQWRASAAEKLQDSPFPGCHKLYLYYYDGRFRRMIKSVLLLSRDSLTQTLIASLYLDTPSISTPEKCRCIYRGEMYPFDSLVNINLVNQSNRVERISINVHKSLDPSKALWGMLSGISNQGFIPVALKILLSQMPVTDVEWLESRLSLSKEEFKKMKQLNMFTLSQEENV